MTERTDANTPAYVSYGTFKNQTQTLALDGTMPKHIDHSVLPTMGGSTRKMYFGALRFLGLISHGDGVPTERLHKMALADESHWKDYMQTLVEERYGPLVEYLVDATPKSFRDCFVEHFSSIGPSVVEPAIRFLFSAARDTGLPVSQRLLQRKPRTAQPKSRRSAKKPNQTQLPDEPKLEHPKQPSFRQALLDKFPSFDPAWPDEHKAAWFSSFGKFMEMTQKREEPAGDPAGS